MARKRILVVDDELTVRQLIMILLSHLGHIPETACDGPEALRKIEAAEFDLVLADFNMPGMKGDELAREIKNRNPQIPVMLVTGSDPQIVSQHISKVLLKPFSAADLRDAIASLT